jgi:hypothetical protein
MTQVTTLMQVSTLATENIGAKKCHYLVTMASRGSCENTKKIGYVIKLQ